MFSRRLSSALYPTQLHRRNVCVHMRAHNSIDIIVSTYTASLMVCARPVARSSEGGIEDEAFLASHKDSWSRCGESGPGALLTHHSITAHKQSIIIITTTRQREEFTQRKSAALLNGCSVRYGPHVHPPCVFPFPTSGAGSRAHAANSSGPHISSSMTSQHHMSLTDGPSVCFPLQDEVHFLCSLCFRP